MHIIHQWATHEDTLVHDCQAHALSRCLSARVFQRASDDLKSTQHQPCQQHWICLGSAVPPPAALPSSVTSFSPPHPQHMQCTLSALALPSISGHFIISSWLQMHVILSVTPRIEGQPSPVIVLAFYHNMQHLLFRQVFRKGASHQPHFPFTVTCRPCPSRNPPAVAPANAQGIPQTQSPYHGSLDPSSWRRKCPDESSLVASSICRHH